MRRDIYGVALLIVVVSLVVSSSSANADSRLESPSRNGVSTALSEIPLTASAEHSYANCRFGVGRVRKSIAEYDVLPLHLGWYVNWTSTTGSPTPGDVEYAHMVRVSDAGLSPSAAQLTHNVLADPGAVWLIGNEPDRIEMQDDVLPEVYAERYYEAYTLIKGLDPTARVAAGGIVQPTPIRLQYLDKVLQAYVARYGRPLETDAWHVHSFILREASCDVFPDSCWGAEIPPGIDADHGELYTLDDFDNLDVFQDRIWDFRRWMYDRGYRNTALWVTEYGTLLPYYEEDSLFYDSNGKPFDEARARAFLYNTFDFMLTANDPKLGYPADSNQLVQRWIWYSLDDLDYGGALFDPYNGSAFQLGLDWAAYTSALAPFVDLVAVDVSQVSVPFSSGEAMTVTLVGRVSNAGNVPLTDPALLRFVDGKGEQIGDTVVISDSLRGCGEFIDFEIDWLDVPPGSHAVTLRVQYDDDGRVENNAVTSSVLVATTRVFLPLVSRARP